MDTCASLPVLFVCVCHGSAALPRPGGAVDTDLQWCPHWQIVLAGQYGHQVQQRGDHAVVGKGANAPFQILVAWEGLMHGHVRQGQ
jgi:hypothetical protein